MPRFVRLFDAASETITAFYDALRRGQTDRAMSLWANEDFVSYIRADGTRWDGLEQIRSGLVAQFAQSVVLLDSLDTTEYDTVGTVVHTATEAMRVGNEDAGQTTAQLIHTTYVLVHEQGDWRFAHIHSSPLPPHAVEQFSLMMHARPDGLH
ncbi:nuclear transport factor 2 family protein [Pandoraea nosoerga]|uniref:SnoaL-like domain-containing protein n=1 Tax=Pandoraea nosoerga TaxID=2508296 RepID=A0A5E4XEM9_9BURK|nr:MULTISPECIES: nuclear transport factor 2 family protein [Pandoraea]MBN4666144.1 nuclear transport factor 2 family protein [Pandoraea nosoerga]MBN4676953.1 nuclear transport factor 2 family protein [Pandoraea nosoerga]MBN4681622.1 nuclear transport factor 2 family protein [Pandoraea nosoerga]MBN4745162.1 nuclear transport factor 2 family protein [Pandoraea nosoerga]VVE34766.1 hypothetical protein PNO31109_03827 [Pandoraea nosoerga]